MRSKADETFLRFVLLFSYHHSFITIITLLLYSIYLRFMVLVTQKLTAISAAKRSKSDERQFQESWIADVFWFVCRNDGAVCTLYSALRSENVACRI